jgi:hypothetical protein
MEVKKLVKLGYMQPEKCVCINLIYFVPKVEFNLYFEATVFGWSAIQEGWSNFAQYLVARNLGDLYVNTDNDHVVRKSLVDDAIISVGEPVLLADCKHINDANKGESGRTFQLDRFHPTVSTMQNLFEICPTAEQHLGAQHIAYVAMAVESAARDNGYRTKLQMMVDNGECSESNMIAFGQECERFHADRYVAASVESNGYSIMGESAEKPGDANLLYTVGLSQFKGYEVYIKEDFPAYDMGILLREVTSMVDEGRTLVDIDAHLKCWERYRKHRPRLVLSRNVKPEQVFKHRVKTDFDIYRLMIDI